jgi:PAS domain S-box-containing protein
VGFVNVLVQRQDIICVERACQAMGDEVCRFELQPLTASHNKDNRVVAVDPDPALGRQLNLLEILFDRMPMGIVILDKDLRIRRFNPTWADFVDRYRPPSAAPATPGVSFMELAPGIEDTVGPVFQRVLNGETLRQKAFRLDAGGVTSYWDAVITPIVEHGEVLGILQVTTDVTDQIEAEQAKRESQRRLSTLISNLPGMAYRCQNEPDWPMEYVSQGSVELTGYTPEQLMIGGSVSYGELIHPEDQDKVWQEVQAALKGGEPFELTYRITSDDGQQKWVWERGRGVYSPQGKLSALEGFISDVTERMMTRQMLEQRVQARTRELATMFDVQRAIISRLDLDAVLQMIADESRALTKASRAAVFILEGAQARMAVVSGEGAPDDFLDLDIPLSGSLIEAAITSGNTVYVKDTQTHPAVQSDPQRKALIERAGGRSLLITPLIVEDQPIGVISITHEQPDAFDADDESVLPMLASGAAIGLENARLYQEEHHQRQRAERRRQVAESLRDVLGTLNSNRPLDEILHFVVTQAVKLSDANAGAIYQLDSSQGRVRIMAADGLSPEFMEAVSFELSSIPGQQAILGRHPFFIPDISAHSLDVQGATSQDPSLVEMAKEYFNALLAVPLIVRDEVYGSIALYYRASKEPSDEAFRLATSFADQAALAIENAQLRSRAEQSAVAAERDRLARDLHDAVTQTLFSTSLIADVLPRIWDKDPQMGRAQLEEIRTLTRGALAEMRNLLVTLRPSALIESDFSDLLRQLSDAFTGRSGVPVQLEIVGDCDLPPEVKVAFYRIAQESLNNIVKHAHASHCSIEMHCKDDDFTLVITDDGVGFDIKKISPESLGVGIMQERAGKIGAELDIQSQIETGTEIRMSWKGNNEEAT